MLVLIDREKELIMNLPLMILIGVVLIFSLIILQAVHSNRQRRPDQQKKMSSLGFKPLDEPPSQLTARFQKLRQTTSNKKVQLRRVYRQSGFDQDIYLFDVQDSNNAHWPGADTLGVISPNLALLRFSLISTPQMGGNQSSSGAARVLMDRIFDWTAQVLGLERITFPNRPEFSRRYTIFSRREGAARRLFTPAVTDYLLGITLPLIIEGEGDFFVVGINPSSPENQTANLQVLYRETIDLARILKAES